VVKSGEKGQQYILKLNISRLLPEQLILMHVSCGTGPLNYSPETAIPLKCDSYTIETENSGFNVIQKYFADSLATYWYSFAGNDSIFSLRQALPDGFTGSIIDENCQIIHTLTPQSLFFQTEKDKRYFLVISHDLKDELPSFTFEINYNCIIDNTEDINHKETLWFAYPNPFTQNVEIVYYSNKEADVVISLFDAEGREIISSLRSVRSGQNTILFDQWSSFPSGVYTLRLMDGNVRKIRLVKL
jgi:hypothetical protein